MDADKSKMRTVVTFKSAAFNVTEPKEYFINSSCFGDDVAKWLISELRKRGVKTDEDPGQEDFGWYLNFEVAGTGHTFVIGHRPGNETEAGVWIGWLERSRGLVGSLTEGRETRNPAFRGRRNSQNPVGFSGNPKCALAPPTRLRRWT